MISRTYTRIWNTNGRACQISPGARISASIGEVWMNLLTTNARTTIQNTQRNIRQSRNLVQSDSLRRVDRSRPPNTIEVQNR